MRNTLCLLLLLALASTVVAETPRGHAPAAFQSKGAFLAFFVPDLDASVTWYSEKLGLEVIDRPPASDVAKVAILEGGGLIVELIQHKEATSRSKETSPFTHGLFKAGVLVSDFDSVVAALKERKVEIAFGPFPARGKQRANVMIRDNNGNFIQFFAD